MDIVVFLLSVIFLLSFFASVKAIKTGKSSLFFEIISALSFAEIVRELLYVLSKK